MRKTEREKYRKMLLDLKARLTGTVEGMRREALEADEAAPSDDHMADHGSAMYDQDLTLTLVEGEQERIRQIDGALQRVEEATFGKCAGCADDVGVCGEKGGDIPKARLDALPWTRFCVAHQEKLEELGEL